MKSPKILGGLALAVTALLTACGGGTSPQADDEPKPRGTLVLGAQFGAATIEQVDAGTAAKGVQALTGTAKCGVAVRYVFYMTRDPMGQPATASAGVLVPSGTDAACTGERPVLLYAHGTTTTKAFNMADVTNNSEASLVMAFYAAQGFIVVAPNYMGYERSGLSFTPYLNAESSAIDMIDGLRAAKTHLLADSPVKPSSKLLIAGYSQGGHVAMATSRAIERGDYGSEFAVTATAPMSGPYNLVKMGDAITNGQINVGATLFLPLQLTSYQKSYGNIYASPSEVYQAPFAAHAETLFPTDTPVNTLIAEGKLPADSTFRALFGTGGLLTDTFRAGYPTSNFRKALQTNTLLGWTPKRPMAMCGGAADPTVFFFNTVDAQADFAARGARIPAFNLEDVSSLPAGVTGQTVYGGFQQAKAAAGAGATAAYHGTLVPPFCNALARGFFQQVLASGV